MVEYFARAAAIVAEREVYNLHFRLLAILLTIFGNGKTQNQPGHATVPGSKAPGYFLGVERNRLDSFYVIVAKRTGIVDERLDYQVVFEGLAMRIVSKRIHAGDVGRSPKLLGKFFDGYEGFPREDCAALWCDRNQRSVGNRVGFFQLFEGDQAWVVLVKMISKINVDVDDVLGARS